MKIAMVGQFPPHVGGVGVHIHTLSKVKSAFVSLIKSLASSLYAPYL